MLQVHSFVSGLLQSGSLTTGCLCFIGFIGFGLGFVSLEQGTGKGSSGPYMLGLIIWKVDATVCGSWRSLWPLLVFTAIASFGCCSDLFYSSVPTLFSLLSGLFSVLSPTVLSRSSQNHDR